MGDYVIARYAKEPQEVAGIIINIGSVPALVKLRSMNGSAIVSPRFYSEACTLLANYYSSTPVDIKLKIKLASMIANIKSPSASCLAFADTITADIPRVAAPVLSQKSFHSDLIDLIEYGYNREIFNEESSDAEGFLFELAGKRLSIDDQRSLSAVLDLQPIGNKEELITAFRASVVSMLSGEIDSLVEDRGVIEDVIDSENLGDARKDVRRFVDGFFDDYYIEFTQSDVEEVADSCDVSGIISRNREAHEEWSRTRNEPRINLAVHDDAFIDELFRSDFPPI